MIRFVFVAVMCFAAAQSLESKNDYEYNFKLTKLSAGMIKGRVSETMSNRLGGLRSQMKGHCKMTKALDKYEKLMQDLKYRPKHSCNIDEDKKYLQLFRDTYKESLKECVSDTTCRAGLDEVVDQTIAAIQDLDSKASKDLTACADEPCKFKVYHDTHEKLATIYEDSFPAIRLAEDAAVSECTSTTIQCMMKNNKDNLQKTYEGIGKLEDCLA